MPETETLPTADRAFTIIALQKKLVTKESVAAHEETVRTRRASGESVSLAEVLVAAGVIKADDREHVEKIRSKHGRTCESCSKLTFMLPGDPPKKPCEHCGGVLRAVGTPSSPSTPAVKPPEPAPAAKVAPPPEPVEIKRAAPPVKQPADDLTMAEEVPGGEPLGAAREVTRVAQPKEDAASKKPVAASKPEPRDELASLAAEAGNGTDPVAPPKKQLAGKTSDAAKPALAKRASGNRPALTAPTRPPSPRAARVPDPTNPPLERLFLILVLVIALGAIWALLAGGRARSLLRDNDVLAHPEVMSAEVSSAFFKVAAPIALEVLVGLPVFIMFLSWFKVAYTNLELARAPAAMGKGKASFLVLLPFLNGSALGALFMASQHGQRKRIESPTPTAIGVGSGLALIAALASAALYVTSSSLEAVARAHLVLFAFQVLLLVTAASAWAFVSSVSQVQGDLALAEPRP